MVSINIQIPDISQWSKNAFDVYHQNAQRLALLTENSLSNSTNYQEQRDQIEELGLRRDFNALFNKLQSHFQVLSFCDLLLTNNQFLYNVGINPLFLNALLLGQERLTNQPLKKLIRLYFEKFNLLSQNTFFNDFCSFIQNQLKLRLNSLGDKPHLTEVDRLGQEAELFFNPKVVTLLNQKAATFSSFDEFLEQYRLVSYRSTELIQQCQTMYYINVLQTIPLGESHPILDEIIEHKTAFLLLDNQRYCLGHIAMHVMIDRNRNQTISQTWLDTILQIAGDPRLARSSESYQTWWMKLPQNDIDQVISWLSEIDLQVFLAILEDSLRFKNNKLRMFEERKMFMMRLLEQKLVTSSRLFLSKSAINYINTHFSAKQKEALKYAQVNTGDLSFMYLNLCGKVHMMEGTHEFSLRMKTEPPSKRLTNYDIGFFKETELRNGFLHQDTKDSINSFYTPHQGNWQSKAKDFLMKKNIRLS